jgi:hypothetical protein
MNLRQIIKRILNEATSAGGSRGSYVGPLQVGIRLFDKDTSQPFSTPVSKYDSPQLEYDSYDGKMDTSKKNIKKIETKAKKNSEFMKKHPELSVSDEDGNVINPTPGKKKKIVPINEVSTSVTAGTYNGPQELGLKIWKKSALAPFDIEVDIEHNDHIKGKHIKNNIKRVVGVWEKDNTGSYRNDTHPVHTVNEDLAVWFGKKKKPKGSSQPKGPWVDICRRVDGKHPPCGRKDADTGSYPKCRAAGVAGKMSDSQKRAACQQKRKAEKKDPQSGKGQKPVMTSYKTKKESVDSIISKVLLEFRNSI